jgi:N-acetylglutamate synthase-like GNAT family acetyltransferase
MLSYRYSHKGDEDAVYNILQECFGFVHRETATKDINCRYLMCFDDDKPVAITGLEWSYTFHCLAFDFTGVIPEYRKQGIIEEMFERLISSTDERIVCSCWRIGDNNVNLHKVMDKFGFELIMKDTMKFKCGYNCSRAQKHCTGYSGDDCTCSEDLYELRGR